MAVGQILSSIRPVSFRTRPESNLELSHHCLKKNFKRFMGYAIRYSEAFQVFGNGRPHSSGEKSITANIGTKDVAETRTKLLLP